MKNVKLRFFKANFRRISWKKLPEKIEIFYPDPRPPDLKRDWRRRMTIRISIFTQFHKNRFLRQISKEFRFFRQFKKLWIFQAKIGYLQLFLGQLLYFSSKVTTFEHRVYFLYMILYNNILRPVRDPHDALPKIWGSWPPIPRIDAYVVIIVDGTWVVSKMGAI